MYASKRGKKLGFQLSNKHAPYTGGKYPTKLKVGISTYKKYFSKKTPFCRYLSLCPANVLRAQQTFACTKSITDTPEKDVICSKLAIKTPELRQ